LEVSSAALIPRQETEAAHRFRLAVFA
jgi:hypothetical protein